MPFRDQTYLPVGMLLLFYSEISVKTSYLFKNLYFFIKIGKSDMLADLPILS